MRSVLCSAILLIALLCFGGAVAAQSMREKREASGREAREKMDRRIGAEPLTIVAQRSVEWFLKQKQSQQT